MLRLPSTVDDGVAWTELALIGVPPMPTPLSELGKRLFFETKHQTDKSPVSPVTTRTMPLQPHAPYRLAYMTDKALATANP